MDKLNQILLVDDDYVDNFLNKRILENMNLAKEILICVSSTEALEHVKVNHPELILLDINMPIMSGLEFLEMLQQHNNFECPVVVLTSSNHPGDIAKAAELRVSYYLVKPLTEDKVRKMIERCFPAIGNAGQ
jgi:CheY-like chemotaxis protein